MPGLGSAFVAHASTAIVHHVLLHYPVAVIAADGHAHLADQSPDATLPLLDAALPPAAALPPDASPSLPLPPQLSLLPPQPAVVCLPLPLQRFAVFLALPLQEADGTRMGGSTAHSRWPGAAVGWDAVTAADPAGPEQRPKVLPKIDYRAARLAHEPRLKDLQHLRLHVEVCAGGIEEGEVETVNLPL